MMKTRLVLKPGQKGTKKLVDQYGKKLVCVRYRYDETRNKRVKTVDLAVEEVDWEPEMNDDGENLMAGVRVGLEEKDLQSELRKAGGVWNREERFWELDMENVERLGVGDRVVAKWSGQG